MKELLLSPVSRVLSRSGSKVSVSDRFQRHRHEVATLLVQHGASAGGNVSVEQVVGCLRWAADKVRNLESANAELVGGIPVWCAQAASEVQAHNSSAGGGENQNREAQSGRQQAAACRAQQQQPREQEEQQRRQAEARMQAQKAKSKSECAVM